MAANGIFCLEGEWDSDLRKRTTVLPVLELLERLRAIKLIHRKVATTGEVEHYLNLWGQARYDDYMVLYLATHGSKGWLSWSNGNHSSLDDLAEILGDSANNCYVHLGSCLTLFNENAARAFVEKTGVRALLGFRAEVGWIESAAFETLLLPMLAEYAPTKKTAKTFFNTIMGLQSDLARRLKFVMVTADGTLSGRNWSHGKSPVGDLVPGARVPNGQRCCPPRATPRAHCPAVRFRVSLACTPGSTTASASTWAGPAICGGESVCTSAHPWT